jgi:hypothetical protein
VHRGEFSVRGAAIAIAGAAMIHLGLTPEHVAEHVLYGAFFLVAAAIQVVLAVGLLRRPGPGMIRLATLSSLGLIGTWIVTRTIVPPLSPESAGAPVDLLGVGASGLEVAATTLLVSRMTLPVLPGRWARATVASLAGAAFMGLFLLASGAISYVDFVRPAPSIDVWNPHVTLQTPLFYGMLLPHIWLVGPWSTFALTASTGLLVTANVAQLLPTGTDHACTVPRRGIAATAPLLIGVSSCCGAQVALFLGASTIGLLYRATPWILLLTVVLLAANLLLSPPEGTIHGLPPAGSPQSSSSRNSGHVE